jgi:hypothetical protein
MKAHSGRRRREDLGLQLTVRLAGHVRRRASGRERLVQRPHGIECDPGGGAIIPGRLVERGEVQLFVTHIPATPQDR